MNYTTSAQTIRVASVPFSQVYIRHLESWPPKVPPPVVRLPDPLPEHGQQTVEATWWPPRMLGAQWIGDHASEFDLMHIHFGFDSQSPSQLRHALNQLRLEGKPLVYTVHDLVNPHQPDPRPHQALLDLLIPAADQLITLTPGAAHHISQQYGRQALVLPHPHVMDFSVMDRIRQRRSAERGKQQDRRVGIHLKGLRPNIAPDIVHSLGRIISQMRGVILQVNIHRQVMDPEGNEYAPGLCAELLDGQSAGLWELQVHEYFTATELFNYLAGLDVSVLPYRFGSHSGWLEAALDAGTHVVAPDCGYYAQQHPSVASYAWNGLKPDELSLEQAIIEQLHRPGLAGMDCEARIQQRAVLAECHQQLYASLLNATPRT